MTLDEARAAVGRQVVYARYDDPFYGNVVTAGPEYGIITSVNDRYVFVRYGNSPTGKATDPADLTLA